MLFVADQTRKETDPVIGYFEDTNPTVSWEDREFVTPSCFAKFADNLVLVSTPALAEPCKIFVEFNGSSDDLLFLKKLLRYDDSRNKSSFLKSKFADFKKS